MHNLTTSAGVLTYLESTRFAALDVELISGGHSAFTYRAKLQTPLPTGEVSIIIKHTEGYIAVHEAMKIEADRAAYEHKALVAVSSSGLFDSDSTVQVPRPIYFDPETNTTFMTDLGTVDTLTKVLADSLQGIHDGEGADIKLRNACALASRAGSALGDFVARFHTWSSQPEQSELREQFGQNRAATNQVLSIHHDMAVRSASMFDLKEPWLNDVIEAERREASTDNNFLAIGDLWLDNVLVSLAPEHGGLRLYVIDWEMARPAPPEFDIGEITGATTSFARRYGVHDVYPFITALHQAYSRHRCLDPVKIARLAGLDTMGFGTVLTWARGESEEFLKQVTLEGYELMRLSHTRDVHAIKSKSLVRHLFAVEAQQMI